LWADRGARRAGSWAIEPSLVQTRFMERWFDRFPFAPRLKFEALGNNGRCVKLRKGSYAGHARAPVSGHGLYTTTHALRLFLGDRGWFRLDGINTA